MLPPLLGRNLAGRLQRHDPIDRHLQHFECLRVVTRYEEHLAVHFRSTRAPQLIQTCRELKSMGALGAKFSGAGGDGSVVALFSDENTARSAAIQLEEKDLYSWYVPVEAP